MLPVRTKSSSASKTGMINQRGETVTALLVHLKHFQNWHTRLTTIGRRVLQSQLVSNSSNSSYYYFQEYLIAVGSLEPDNARTELLSRSTSTWLVQASYPFGTAYFIVLIFTGHHFITGQVCKEIPHLGSYISYYSIVAFNSSFYFFGGWRGSYHLGSPACNSYVIASFSTNTKQWKRIGFLNNARNSHGVMIDQGEFIIVGGYNEKIGLLGTERCSLIGDSMKCTTVDPGLEGYYYTPELMSVSENFCPK